MISVTWENNSVSVPDINDIMHNTTDVYSPQQGTSSDTIESDAVNMELDEIINTPNTSRHQIGNGRGDEDHLYYGIQQVRQKTFKKK